MVPFAYIALIYQNARFSLATNLSFAERRHEISYFLICLVKDLPLLIIITIGNTIHFVKSLYYTDLKQVEENKFNRLSDLRDLDKNTFDLFRKKLGKKLIKDLREEFDVPEHLRRIIYCCYQPNVTDESIEKKLKNSEENLSGEFKLKREKKQIKEQFNLIKKFIVNNSIPFEVPAMKKVPFKEEAQETWDSNPNHIHSYKTDEFNLDALKKFKQNKIKKRRVIDASKVLKIIEESEEQAHFFYILNSKGDISMDHEKQHVEINEFNRDRVKDCDFNRIKPKLRKTKDPKIHMMNINKNYMSLEASCQMK